MFPRTEVTDVPHASSRWSAWLASLAAHLLTASLAVWITAVAPPVVDPQPSRSAPEYNRVWMESQAIGPSHGGGGGEGDNTPLAGRAQQPGNDRRTVPSAVGMPSPTSQQPPPAQTLLIPVVPMAAGGDARAHRCRGARQPNYTADAMRAKMQGVVLVECVVMPDGTVGSARIARSLDRTFGLDHEAVKAARQWRFIPGTRRGQAVAVLVTIGVAFTLR